MGRGEVVESGLFPACSRFVIVFDNYQDVPAGSQLHEIISNGLSVMPAGITVLILSRGEPPASFARLRAHERMAAIGWDDLRLTPDESGEFLKMRGYKGLPKATAEALHQRTEGWAAGLVLMTENIGFDESRGERRRGGAKARRVRDRYFKGRQNMFDYFAGEIFEKADKKTRDFLQKTAFLPTVTVQAAQKLTGNGRSEDLLSGLVRDNYFTQRLSGSGGSYRFHTLFREFLLSRAEHCFTHDRLAETKKIAAGLSLDSGQTEEAAVLFIGVKDWNSLARLIMANAPSVMEQGRNLTLEGWLTAVPQKLLDKTPWLSYWLGACKLPFNPAESRRLFERAFKSFKVLGDASGVFLSWAGVVTSIVYGFENFKSLRPWSSEFNRLTRSFRFPSVEIEMHVLSTIFFASVFDHLQYDADRWIERALALAHAHADIKTCPRMLSDAAQYLIGRRGDLVKAAAVIKLLKEIAASRTTDPLVWIIVRLTEAAYYHMTAEHTLCMEAVSDLLRRSRSSGLHIMDLLAMGMGALSALNTGETQTAGSLLRDMAASADAANLHQKSSFYLYLKACEALCHDDLRQAAIFIDLSLKVALDLAYSSQSIGMIYIAKAIIMHMTGKRKDALKSLSHAEEVGRRIKCRFVESACLLAKAYFAFCDGNEPPGVKLLRKALAIARGQGFYITFIWHRAVVTLLCAKALEEGIEVEYVQELIRRCNIAPPDDNPPENWPYPIKIYTLGRFEILKDESPVYFSSKAQKKPFELLKALVAFGGTDVSSSRITDALWPEAEGDAGHKSFEITLLRLRKLLGRADAVRLRYGHAALSERHCWTDVRAFERIFDRAIALWNIQGGKATGRPAGDEALLLSEKAMAMYKGHFLPADSSQHWIFSRREHLKSKFLRLVLITGVHLERTGRWEKALELFHKGLEADDVAEEFYQHIMLCNQKLGRKAGAVKAYNRCRSALSATLGITPSSRTEEIYSRL